MTLYLDTSVIVKLYIQEADSDRIASEVADADAVCSSVLAYPEACAAFEQRRRAKSVSAQSAKAAKLAFDADWSSWAAVGVDDQLIRQSARLAEQFGLRGADAVHLASFERLLANAPDEDVRFICADERLSKAAGSLG